MKKNEKAWGNLFAGLVISAIIVIIVLIFSGLLVLMVKILSPEIALLLFLFILFLGCAIYGCGNVMYGKSSGSFGDGVASLILAIMIFLYILLGLSQIIFGW